MAKYSVRFVHKVSPSDQDVGADVEILDGAFSDSKKLGRALRDTKVLLSGARVVTFRVEGDKVVVFPRLNGLSTYWHAVVLTKVKPDFRLVDGGSVFLLCPQTPAGSAWIEENIGGETTWLGDGLAIEHRFVCDVIDGIQGDELTVERG